MSGYSEQSQKLAKALAEKAARNLRRSGRIVEHNAVTGQYVVKGKSRTVGARKDSAAVVARRAG